MTGIPEDEERELMLAGAMEARAQDPAQHSPDLTRDAAQTIAEAVRALNYATGPYSGSGIVYPSTLLDLYGALRRALGMFPQLAQQSADWLTKEAAAGRIIIRDGEYAGQPEAAAAAAADALAQARALAATLAEVLGEVTHATVDMAAE
ncbi:MAG TPA: hypothetical protein VGL93_10640 [Streptosporangiaceae bacterium]|jgi:hypothetical protein